VHKLKLISIGDATGVELPNELLSRLNLKKDDVLYLAETPDGFFLTPAHPATKSQMESARRIMKKRNAALRDLA